MNLIKTSLLNGIAVGVRISTALALNKVLALYVGAAGYAVIGQFQNFVNMLITLASGALNTGVVKYTAEYHGEADRQFAIWRTAGTVALVGSSCVGLLIVLLHRQLSVWVLQTETYGGVFIWLGIGLVLFTMNGLLLAILNGKKEIRSYVTANIASSIFGLIVTACLAMAWGLYGALVALAINQSIVFFVTLVLCRRTGWFRMRYLFGAVDPTVLPLLSKFAIMAVTSAVCIPGSQFLIRLYLGEEFGWTAAGYWEALTRISGLYLMVVTTPLSIYYLPRLSEIRDKLELRKEILSGYRIILPVAALGSLTVYALRHTLIALLFTEEFAPMETLFGWQMLGDTIKIGSWLLGYILLSKAMVKAYVVTEIVFSASWVALVCIMTGYFGEVGAQIGYFINYVLHWLVIAMLVIRKFR